MSSRAVSIALLFAFISGVFWWFVGQILPLVVPMMLDDGQMLNGFVLLTIGALALYMVAAMGFFQWLTWRKRN